MRFEPHRRPNESRLEKYRSEITAMRKQNWPYRKIATWLTDECRLTVSKEAVRKFCLLRKITKGKPPRTRRRVKPTTQKKEKLFEYDDSKPIQLRKYR